MRRIRNPVTGRSYPVRQRKTSAATIENIKTLWKNKETNSGKRFW